jgi:hypothetical protein
MQMPTNTQKDDSYIVWPPSSQRSHRVPQRQDLGLLLQHLFDFFAKHRLMDHSLVAELVHPLVAHDKVTPHARRIRPRVLHAPAHRLIVLVKVHGSKDHGVCHLALTGEQTLSFAQAELNVEAQLVVDEVRIHDTFAGVGLLAYIGAEEDGRAFAQHGDAGFFQHGGVDVDVRDWAGVPDVAQVGDGEEAVVGVAWVVGQGDELCDFGGGGEFEGREGDGLELVGAVVEFPGEFLVGGWWWAEAEGDDADYVLQHGFFGGCDGGGRGVAGLEFAELEAVLAELSGEKLVHC